MSLMNGKAQKFLLLTHGEKEKEEHSDDVQPTKKRAREVTEMRFLLSACSGGFRNACLKVFKEFD